MKTCTTVSAGLKKSSPTVAPTAVDGAVACSVNAAGVARPVNIAVTIWIVVELVGPSESAVVRQVQAKN